MRITVLLVLLPGCLFAPNGGTDCIGDSPEPRFVPELGTCVEVGDAEACQACATGRCVVGDGQDLASCGGSCATADETTCLARTACIAAYVIGGFASCWSTAPSGPVHDGACAGLDAHACSRHDNCSVSYVHADDGTLTFARCIDEPAARPG